MHTNHWKSHLRQNCSEAVRDSAIAQITAHEPLSQASTCGESGPLAGLWVLSGFITLRVKLLVLSLHAWRICKWQAFIIATNNLIAGCHHQVDDQDSLSANFFDLQGLVQVPMDSLTWPLAWVEVNGPSSPQDNGTNLVSSPSAPAGAGWLAAIGWLAGCDAGVSVCRQVHSSRLVSMGAGRCGAGPFAVCVYLQSNIHMLVPACNSETVDKW